MATIPEYCQVLRVLDSKGEVKEMLFPKALDLYRPKRPRTMFTSQQITELEKEFRRNPYLIGDKRIKLAEKLNLTDMQIKVWFQNRRTKNRKRNLMSTNALSYSDAIKRYNVIGNITTQTMLTPNSVLPPAAKYSFPSKDQSNYSTKPITELPQVDATKWFFFEKEYSPYVVTFIPNFRHNCPFNVIGTQYCTQ